jgi:hypothetical protein
MASSNLFTPSATQGIKYALTYSHYQHPHLPLTHNDNDHHLLRLLTCATSGEELLRRDADLCIQRTDNVYLEEGAVLFSPNRNLMTTHTNQIRRRGNAVLFPNGDRHPRGDCFTLTLLGKVITLRKTYRKPQELPPTERTREDPCCVCLEDLTGNLITCPNRHQIHDRCFQQLDPYRRRCPQCRVEYPPAERNRNERVLISTELIYPNETRRNADLRFVGLLRKLHHQYDTTHSGHFDLLAYLDTLDLWIRTPRNDYLLDCLPDGTPYFNGTDRPAWREFLTYLTSQENKERLSQRRLTPNSHYDRYDEQRFLADLIASHGVEATQVLAQAHDQDRKDALRRKTYLTHRFTDQSLPLLIRPLLDLFNARTITSHRITIQEVETE